MSGTDKKPEIVVFAGPNGSGKSTITALLRPTDMPYINADDIQRILGCDNLTAAQMAEKQREDHLQKHKSFCFETVLSTPRNLDLLRRAKEKIISRYERALSLVKDLIPVCDVCHIYDNSEESPYRIFKKRKTQCWYCSEPHLWLKADISALTGIVDAEKAALNKHN